MVWIFPSGSGLRHGRSTGRCKRGAVSISTSVSLSVSNSVSVAVSPSVGAGVDRPARSDIKEEIEESDPVGECSLLRLPGVGDVSCSSTLPDFLWRGIMGTRCARSFR